MLKEMSINVTENVLVTFYQQIQFFYGISLYSVEFRMDGMNIGMLAWRCRMDVIFAKWARYAAIYIYIVQCLQQVFGKAVM